MTKKTGNDFLPTIYQQYIAMSRYSRYIAEKGRRETFEETVDRYIQHFKKYTDNNDKIPWDELREAVLNLEVMPSMRALMTAGVALEKDNVAGYNCSALAIDNQKAFDEILYILMCGCGVGFSVESRYTNKLPEVPDELHETDTTIVFKDSKIGWATGLREFISLLYSGKIPSWDLSKIRPHGARLKTFGGRASGPLPLIDLLEFIKKTFLKSRGRKLSTLECHDIVCKIADIVVVGGIRRSALISLSDLNDDHMRNAKSGQWWITDGHRQLANISAVYESKPDMDTFMREWVSLHASKSGERGIFSRSASQKVAAKYGRRTDEIDYLTNPCSEIILRPSQFCNLSEVVIRPEDRLEDLIRKIKLASILGTLQATQTNFRYLNKKWRNNTEEEALLGVSLTGIMDHDVLSGVKMGELYEWLPKMREEAVKTNKEFSKILGINQAAAITCVKPSGSVSQLVDCASGIHPRYSEYYIRRVRQDKKDPLAAFMISQGYVAEDDFYGDSRHVFSFPMKAPENAVTVKDITAIDQLILWKTYQEHWCEHKPSITVYVGEEEWMEVGAWVYENIDILSGVSFLPRDTGSYRQAPYEEITKEQYEQLTAQLPNTLNWDSLVEETDNTESAKTLACTNGACEL